MEEACQIGRLFLSACPMASELRNEQTKSRHVAEFPDHYRAIGEPSIAFIAGSMPVATRGRRTKGKLRWLPITEQPRSRISANDGSVVGCLKQASFDHLVCSRE
jgi:hypothetical protein